MCRGISILKARINRELIELYNLERLSHRRAPDADEELWFDYAGRVEQVLIPIITEDEIALVEWGNRNGKSKLPKTGWCRQESLDAGKWRYLSPEPVEIPATYGLEKGIWFQITEGIRGISVQDEHGHPRVYMLTEPASHYYEVMTRHNRMPVLIGERM